MLECAFDGTDDVFDLEVNLEPLESEEEEGEESFREIKEYGYGLWTKWSRTSPKYLPEKAAWHSLIRLTTNKNHGNDRSPGDRTLAIWVGRGILNKINVGYYHFATYDDT